MTKGTLQKKEAFIIYLLRMINEFYHLSQHFCCLLRVYLCYQRIKSCGSFALLFDLVVILLQAFFQIFLGFSESTEICDIFELFELAEFAEFVELL